MTKTRVVRAARGRTIAQSRSRRTLSVSRLDWLMEALAEQSGLQEARIVEYDQSFFII